MRRTLFVVLAALIATLAASSPALAGAGTGDGGHPVDRPWVRFPSAPFDLAGGVYCAFPVHADPTVDEVFVKTIEEYADGTPKRQLAAGPLKFRMTNTVTGRSTVVDAGGSAVFDLFRDGSRTWHVIGPVLASFKDGSSNIGRGVWTINGIYTVHFSPTNFKTVTIIIGGIHDVCADLA